MTEQLGITAAMLSMEARGRAWQTGIARSASVVLGIISRVAGLTRACLRRIGVHGDAAVGNIACTEQLSELISS